MLVDQDLGFSRGKRDFLKKMTAASSLSLLPMMSNFGQALAHVEPSRIISIDYGVATTLLALGVEPVGIASADHWGRWVGKPELPQSVANIGQDLVVNMEVVAALKPDLVFLTPYTQAHKSSMERIAKVEIISIYQPDAQPIDRAFIETKRIANLLNMPEQGDAYIQKVRDKMDEAKQRLSSLSVPPVTFINFMDERHVRVFGSHSLYQNVLDYIGLENGWQGETNYWGFRTIGLEDLAISSQEDMELIVFEPVADDIRPMLAKSPLWKDLPVVKQNKMTILPAVLMFGMLPSVERFIDLVLTHLERQYS